MGPCRPGRPAAARERRGIVPALLIEPEGRKAHDQRREPDHPRAVAVVRVGEHAADHGIGEERAGGGRGKPAEIVHRLPPRAPQHQRHEQQHGGERERLVDRVDGGEVELTPLLPRGMHGGGRARRELLDHADGVPRAWHDAFAGRDVDELTQRRDRGGLELPGRIGAETLADDQAHLVAEPRKAAEPVEHRAVAAPEERVGVVGQLVAVHAQPQPLVGAMLVQDSGRRCRPAACGRTRARRRPASRRSGRR